MARRISALDANPGLFVRRPEAAERLARDLQGKYAKMQHQAEVAHARMARDAAIYIQDELRGRIRDTGRQQNVGKGRNSHLIRALSSPKNRIATKDGFAVVLDEFMNSSKAAPYWRNLEYGSRVHVGREMSGFFLSRSGRVFPPLSNERFHRHGRLIQTGATFGGTKENFTSTIKVGKNEGGKGTINNRGGGFRIVIKNPIPAYEYASQGAANFLAAGGTFDKYYKQALKDTPYKGGGKPKVTRTRS